MSLDQILQGAFFTEYVKRGRLATSMFDKRAVADAPAPGNVLMLSEGKTTVDDMFTLREGMMASVRQNPQV